MFRMNYSHHHPPYIRWASLNAPDSFVVGSAKRCLTIRPTYGKRFARVYPLMVRANARMITERYGNTRPSAAVGIYLPSPEPLTPPRDCVGLKLLRSEQKPGHAQQHQHLQGKQQRLTGTAAVMGLSAKSAPSTWHLLLMSRGLFLPWISRRGNGSKYRPFTAAVAIAGVTSFY